MNDASQTGHFWHWRTALRGAQMLFVAFGALVLVPEITGLDSNVALFTAGIGTLLFHFITRLQVPIFLASSFAFVAPIQMSVERFGIPSTMGALMVTGFIYVLLAGLVKWRGPGIIHRVMPPVVTGPIIMIIGLNLAPNAVNMAMGLTGNGAARLFPYEQAIPVAMIALLATLLVSVYAKGILKLLPIIVGIVVGYITAWFMGITDLSKMDGVAWVAVPDFVAPIFNWQAIVLMIPVAIAPAVEHVGDIIAIGNVTGKDYIRKPGLQRTLLGDGLATSLAGLFGGPPNTTYSEVTGAVTLTKAFDPRVMIWAAICAILLGFGAKVGAFIHTIPTPVMGGIMILLFGSIAAVGLNTLIKAQVDLTHQRNLVIVAVTLVFGIGGMFIGTGDFKLEGIALCGIVAIVLNLILPHPEPESLDQETEMVDDLINHR